MITIKQKHQGRLFGIIFVGFICFFSIVSIFLDNPSSQASLPSGNSYESINAFQAPAPQRPPFQPFPHDIHTEVQPGDTFERILDRHNISLKSGYVATTALREKNYDLGKLKVGQTLWLRKKVHENEQNQLANLRIDLNEREIINLEIADKPEMTILNNSWEHSYYAVRGRVKNSLYGSLAQMGLSDNLVVSYIDIFGFDVDFQRDIREGDEFSMVYEVSRIKGSSIKDVRGRVLNASLQNGSRELHYYLFEDSYYDENGKSAQKALMRTPVPGARLSSGYGMRMHPIKGFRRKHSGVDFAAPTGTPIYAAGDGVIEKRAYNKNGYGRYLVIRHNSTYKTLYAHMSKYGRSTSVGSRVKQRQIIGYVGSTGLSTGPHLHYEVIKNNKKVNPSAVKLPEGKTVAKEKLSDFTRLANELNSLRAYADYGEKMAIEDKQIPSEL